MRNRRNINFSSSRKSNPRIESSEEQYYYRSSYFYFSFPTYALWRLWLALFHLMAGEQACETFSVVFRRNPTASEATTNNTAL